MEPPLTKVVTGPVSLAHCRLYRPVEAFGQGPRFSAVILVPKTETRTIAVIRAAQANALAAGEAKFGKAPLEWRDSFRDGDADPALENNPQYAGHWFTTASSQTPPGVIDSRRKPIFNTTTVTDGSLVRVSLNAFAYRHGETVGVGFALNHVQQLEPPAVSG